MAITAPAGTFKYIKWDHIAAYLFTDEFSFSVWIKADGWGGAGWDYLFRKNDYMDVRRINNSNDLKFQIEASPPAAYRSATMANAHTILLDNVWHLLCGTFKRNDFIKLYVDDQEEASGATEDKDLTANAEILEMPGDRDDPSLEQTWEDFRFFNRTLPLVQIQEMFFNYGHDTMFEGMVARFLGREREPGVAAAVGSVKDDTVGRNDNDAVGGVHPYAETAITYRRRRTR